MYDCRSNHYHAVIYRKDETITKESVLEDFMYFVERESEYEISPENIQDIQNLIAEFLPNFEKARKGELEMLEKWSRSINDTVSK